MSTAPANPLLTAWTTPFAMPPYAAVKPEHFAPAFNETVALHKAEIDAIASNPEAPTFANTIETMELAGKKLSDVSAVFFNLSSAHTSKDLQSIERDIRPKLAAHYSSISLNAPLFRRIDVLFERRKSLGLDAEQMRLIERYHTGFVRAGAKLGEAAKARVAEIDQRMATLTTQFSQNVLADEQAWKLELESEDDMAGLSPALRAAALRAGDEVGLPGKHVITLARSSVESFLQYSDRRDLREEAFKAWIRRGENGGTTDNRALIAEVVALRAERARLLGYPTYAHYRLDDTMAQTPDAVRGLLTEVWGHAKARAGEERDALQTLARAQGGNFAIAAWDWRYYAEKERKARYDLDEAEVRPYLQLDKIIAAAFDTASRLFGLSFSEIPDAPRYHPDVRIWEVQGRDGRHVGVFLGDYFARPSKRSGAWMSKSRGQWKLNGEVRPIIHNTCNFAKGGEGEPSLLSFDDAKTLFHEFGHALHGLLSDVTYPSLACTNVSTDFVELPSQLYEHWLSTPQVLKNFARHYKTGEPMPQSLLDRLNAARNFNMGWATVEYTSSALVDMALHALPDPTGIDVSKFESEELARLGMPEAIVMRHRLPHFSHIMGGYAAAYYSYMWSEVMDADAFGAFEETGNPFAPEVAARLEDFIYAAGNRRDPKDAYIAFRGRLPKVDSMLRKRGFAA